MSATSYFMRPLALLMWAAMAASVMMVLAIPAQAATITVNSLADDADGADGECTLREAITAANTDTASGAADGECAQGSQDDVINFALPGAAPWTVNLTGALPSLTSNMAIEGPGADRFTVRRDTGGDYRIFFVGRASEVTISGITIANGNSRFSGGDSLGGGIYNGGTLTLTNSTVSGNTGWDYGGGIYISDEGTLNVANSTVSGNTVRGLEQYYGNGGGLFTSTNGTVNVTNSTVSGNIATDIGGGIYAQGGSLVQVTNSTVFGNTGNGGGIYTRAPVKLGNTIVAGNRNYQNRDVSGPFASQGHNLIGRSEGSTGFTNGQNGDQVGTAPSPIDPMLGPLADNGGPTKTHALLEGSPAIDKGDSFGATTDQRGVARPQGTASDIGSFESAFTVIEDTLKPHVSTVTPTGPGIARGTNLTATFSEKMDPLSITNSTFKLFKVKPDGSTTQITNVRVKLSTDGLVAKLNPFGTSSTLLSANTKYRGVITTGAKDVAGNQLDQDQDPSNGLKQKAWTFTIRN